MPNYSGGGSFIPTDDIQLSGNVRLAGTSVNASGSTTIVLTSQQVTATGATAGAGAAITAIGAFPALVTATGTSGAGVDLPAATTGAFAIIVNKMTGVLKIYSSGNTINGTTGTTAFNVTATGNLTAFVMCTTAGAWSISGNT